MTRQYVVGLDLGQAQDFTAVAVLERTQGPDPGRDGRVVSAYSVRHLERLPLGTAYPAVVQHVRGLVARPELARPVLAVDQTGVGRAVTDLLGQAGLPCRLVPVTITAGHGVTGDGRGGTHVPKKDLVSAVQVLLQSRRLRIARELALADTLTRELLSFRVQITAALNETYGAWRERDHDDLVLAVALAAWAGECVPEPYTGPLVYWPPVPGFEGWPPSAHESGHEERDVLIRRACEEMDRRDGYR